MVQLVGILNITPDSFSDGNLYLSPEDAITRCRQMMDEGATIIDVGAESTRPGAAPLQAQDEWQRLVPILPDVIAITHQRQCLVSLDTYHPENAARAIALGVDWINDVTGLTHPNMLALAKDTQAMFVVMHHLGIPANPNITIAADEDALAVIQYWAIDTLDRLESAGVDLARIILDPGIGFGKTAEQSITLINRMNQLTSHVPTPILVGHSRKSFLKAMFPDLSPTRDAETLAISKELVEKGVTFLRIHAIGLHSKAFTR